MNSFRLTSRVLPLPRGAPPPVSAGPMAAGEAPLAVPVPWRVVTRSDRGVIEIEQRSTGPLRAVRLALAGGGMLGLSLPRTVHPGERVRVVLRGVRAEGALAAPDAMLVLRWFQADGTELLWPVAL
ncbi:MAG: hypothetical protein ACNYNX_00880 [Leucobacter sp.]